MKVVNDAVFFLIEVVLILTMRDSFLINMIMLTYPIESLTAWHTGGCFK